MNRSRLESLGMYVPEKVLTTKELINQMYKEPAFDLEELTGIRKRHHVDKHETTLSVALNSMNDCLSHSKYSAEDLDIIINCSISRFDSEGRIVYEPSIVLQLKREIGATNANFFTIGNACAGMGTAIHLLDKMIKAGIVKNGMVVSGEFITPISDTALKEIKKVIDPQFASLTVGDAAVSVILEETAEDTDEGIEYSHFITFAEFSDFCFGLPSYESGQAAMYTDAIGIHREAIEHLSPFIHDAFKRKGVHQKADEWDYSCKWLIPHQTSSKAIASGKKRIADYFGIDWNYWDPTVLSRYLKEFGNTASTSHFLSLGNGFKDGVIKKGEKAILLFQASGIVLGIISVKLGNLNLNPKGCRQNGDSTN